MVLREKVLEYMKTHKNPVTTRQIANYYIVAVSSVATVFRELAKDEIVTLHQLGGKNYWSLNRFTKIKAAPLPVAVPDDVDTTQPRKSPAIVPRPRPIQNSYPNVRGYED